eukprot:GFYU01007784.1.p1 GENE.GFYU01007784.1~~GFYU01007784.1.p1  ORF type:complete len:413 (-),score=84.82 GFYU01007784.1:197-1405(-)
MGKKNKNKTKHKQQQQQQQTQGQGSHGKGPVKIPQKTQVKAASVAPSNTKSVDVSGGVQAGDGSKHWVPFKVREHVHPIVNWSVSQKYNFRKSEALAVPGKTITWKPEWHEYSIGRGLQIASPDTLRCTLFGTVTVDAANKSVSVLCRPAASASFTPGDVVIGKVVAEEWCDEVRASRNPDAEGEKDKDGDEKEKRPGQYLLTVDVASHVTCSVLKSKIQDLPKHLESNTPPTQSGEAEGEDEEEGKARTKAPSMVGCVVMGVVNVDCTFGDNRFDQNPQCAFPTSNAVFLTDVRYLPVGETSSLIDITPLFSWIYKRDAGKRDDFMTFIQSKKYCDDLKFHIGNNGRIWIRSENAKFLRFFGKVLHHVKYLPSSQLMKDAVDKLASDPQLIKRDPPGQLRL